MWTIAKCIVVPSPPLSPRSSAMKLPLTGRRRKRRMHLSCMQLPTCPQEVEGALTPPPPPPHCGYVEEVKCTTPPPPPPPRNHCHGLPGHPILQKAVLDEQAEKVENALTPPPPPRKCKMPLAPHKTHPIHRRGPPGRPPGSCPRWAGGGSEGCTHPVCDCRRAHRPCSSRPCASPAPPAAAVSPGLSTPATWPPHPCPGGHKLPLNFALSDKVKTQHCFITLLCLTRLKDNTASSLLCQTKLKDNTASSLCFV